MHTGEQYHQFFLTSRREVAVRDRFRELALGLLAKGADVLDFGAGTGIDAKAYVANGHRTFVHEPSPSMRGHLELYCHDEVARGAVVCVDADLPCRVDAVTANFAVLNHIADQTPLFEQLYTVVNPGGFVLASMLNPYFLGDARYGWWRRNLFNLFRHGFYSFETESGIHRFAPRVPERAAAPYFRLERRLPGGFGMLTEPYLFLLFRRT
ncbi:class I SAM-dependent methyltransferase [Luteibacter yeojuensis]|uniref:Class I SAM-dependent methyltransferase n=1 Tax=Luteibacter yeojuensis TaxID=345309 RepID=A0A7X5QWG0_9GAMM|nr:class I SAM-dependent methyltransferase [Luteibacter yeojuensis]NID16626.1 class I SAM-dependent methyltransferase [Luteibacter yeojuensis]